ncbi:hypothetical protein Tsubulata_048911 [Turnera subulata]|uniref:Uncharacterized protein n=1 Tax=Turnera subulata TaxID=218843 RepID=A0A9Q0FUJ5_9ROSI|nr:hypothetical protein Tsubulata_048911 [Turnera subulata]
MWYSTPAFRWPAFGLSLPTTSFRWWPSGFDLSYFTAGWSIQSFRWLEFSFDEVLWTFVMVLESLALASMLCYYFLFCGCTL